MKMPINKAENIRILFMVHKLKGETRNGDKAGTWQAYLSVRNTRGRSTVEHVASGFITS